MIFHLPVWFNIETFFLSKMFFQQLTIINSKDSGLKNYAI